jgi:tRNA1(Val) A37 N6-methylase TrmN6
MISLKPYDSFTHSTPWLMEINNDDAIIGPEGIPLTASYIWNKSETDRENLVNWVFNYYRSKGFVKLCISDDELIQEFENFKAKDANIIINNNGEINNSSSICNNVYKQFVWDKYHMAKGNGKSKSVVEVFNDDVLFMNVLKNRMGYCISKEDGIERPYVFTITDKMILQGIRSTGLGYNVSLFKPLVGKYLYKNYAKKRVFDYSAGWGARCLAALSLGLEYYGVDPLTFNEVNNMMKFFNGFGKVINGGSEDANIYDNLPKVDCIMSSPPYFDLEIYSNDDNQSVKKYCQYENWLNIYWNNTVKNCMGILEDSGYFILIIKEVLKKINISKDMKDVCEKNGLVLTKEMRYRTSLSHLSDKKNTKVVSKNSEIVYIFTK